MSGATWLDALTGNKAAPASARTGCVVSPIADGDRVQAKANAERAAMREAAPPNRIFSATRARADSDASPRRGSRGPLSQPGVAPIRERPILFSAAMVRAILVGTKSQTRRIAMPKRSIEPMTDECPRGQPGDRLWVRETWQFAPLRGIYVYRADPTWSGVPAPTPDGRWRSSIHMPRCASRITLEITDVRVERVQDISRDDAIAEGVEWNKCPTGQTAESLDAQMLAHRIGKAAHYVADIDYVGGFRWLWESINGRDSWHANPFVWVIEFRRIAERSAA